MDAFSIVSHRFLDVAALIPVPTNIANRDDNGRPKTTIIGNVRRLSFSPQFTKLGLRRGSRHGANLIRTKYLPALIVDQILRRGEDYDYTNLPDKADENLFNLVSKALYNNASAEDAAAERAVKAAEIAAAKAAKKALALAKKNGTEVEVVEVVEAEVKEVDVRTTAGLLLITQQEVDNLVKEIRALHDSNSVNKATLKNAVKVAFQTAQRSDQALVRSMYGRMVTNCEEMIAHPDGALQLGWPFSVEKANIMSEYTTAVDDQHHRFNRKPGAGHIAERQQAIGSTMFVQFQIDLDLLATNAGYRDASDVPPALLKDIVLDTVETLVFRPFANAASQGNFRTSPRACLAIARVSRNGCLYDFAPAFEKPVTYEDDYAPSEVASRRLMAYLGRTAEAYNESLGTTVFAIKPEVLDEKDVANTKEAFIGNVSGLLDMVLS